MCSTHLPPRAAEDLDRSIQAILDAAGHAQPPPVSSDSHTSRRTASAEERRENDDPSNLEFVTNTSRGQLCAFIPGYLEFLPETNITVSSINLFMPGIKMAVATQPIDFHVYNRYGNVNIDHFQCHRQCTQIMAIANPQEVCRRNFSSMNTWAFDEGVTSSTSFMLITTIKCLVDTILTRLTLVTAGYSQAVPS